MFEANQINKGDCIMSRINFIGAMFVIILVQLSYAQPSQNQSYHEELGVGITNPLSPFHVKGNQIESFTDTTRGIISISGDFQSGYYTPIDFLYNSDAYPTARIAAYHDRSGSKLLFGTSYDYSSGITGTAMTIDRLGKIGIGTTSPSKTLDVMGGVAFQGNNIYLRNTASPVNRQTWGMVVSTSNGQFNLGPTTDTPPGGGSLLRSSFILQHGAPSYSFLINSNGNIGIGTANPAGKLHIHQPHANFVFDGSLSTGGYTANMTLDNTGLKIGHNSNSRNIEFQTGSATCMTITPGGNIGIGTTNPQSKLAVNGKITAKEIECTLNGWADFVFEENYKLRSLEEVEAHIKDNGHLPDIPSAKAVLNNGVNLGEMQSKLLQKIEELTLYVINLKKENDILKGRISSLEDL